MRDVLVRWWRRIGPWLTPVLIVVEIVLVWSGVLSLLNAVLIIVVVEVLLGVTVIGRTFVAVRRFRAGRARGLDAWGSAEDAMSQMLPRPAARVVLIEAHMWVCLIRSVSRCRAGVYYGYGRNLRGVMWVVLALLVVEGVVVELVLVAVLGSSSPWVWVAFGLHVYGLIWIGGFLASLHVMPHEVEGDYLRLRDSVFTTVTVPLSAIQSVSKRQRGNSGRSGWKVDDDGVALLAYGDAAVRVRLVSGGEVLVGNESETSRLWAIDLSADDPDAFVDGIRASTRGMAPDIDRQP